MVGFLSVLENNNSMQQKRNKYYREKGGQGGRTDAMSVIDRLYNIYIYI